MRHTIRLYFFYFLLFTFCVFLSCAHKHSVQIIGIDTTKERSPYFLFISDIHLDVSTVKTDSTTDTGIDLWNSFKTKISSILESNNPPAFVLCTGDLAGHDDCDGKCFLTGALLQKRIADLNATLTDLRNLVATHKIPLYYTPGNNDALAGDYYSFTNDKGQTPFAFVPDMQNPYPALNVSATSNAAAPALLSMPHPSMGYYSVLAIPGLRVIALNTVIFNPRYKAADSIGQVEAGNEEMQWLSQQLKEAALQKQKVFIAMHIPPGTDAYKVSKHKTPNTTWAELPAKEESWERSFLRLTAQYQTTITGMFYGHTHMDELRLLYDSTDTAITGVAIAAPGVTMQHGNNPGFKTVSFNPQTMAINDFTTYYTTLPVTGAWGNDTYRFSDIFKSGNMTVYDFLKTQDSKAIHEAMDKIYTVMHGAPKYDTEGGLFVKWE